MDNDEIESRINKAFDNRMKELTLAIEAKEQELESMKQEYENLETMKYRMMVAFDIKTEEYSGMAGLGALFG